LRQFCQQALDLGVDGMTERFPLGLDGIELARRANRLWPALRLMLITGFAAVALRQRNATQREAAVLAKPFHLRQLVTRDRPLSRRVRRQSLPLATSRELVYTPAFPAVGHVAQRESTTLTR
jgi:DNA-binding response OmpR family regulator